ncbi:MAG: hypothetical protein Q8880_00965 [Bacteroidota bacterium]|nr:hypothetical protein [Bacteroidota bacterium]
MEISSDYINKYKPKKIFLLFISLFLFLYVAAQQQGERNKFFFVTKAGYGKPYGGYGLNFESGLKNIGAYIALGYTPSQKADSLYTIKSSVNFGMGIEYFFGNARKNLRPKAGLYMGWLNNYYSNSAANIKDYNPNIYGYALSGGLEYYQRLFFMDFGIHLVPAFLLPWLKNTPYSRDQRIRISPSIGIGININAIRENIKDNKLFKKEKSEKSAKAETLIKTEKERKIEIREEKIDSSKQNCISSGQLKGNYINGACGNVTVYQQLFDKKYVIVTLNPDSIYLTTKCNEYGIHPGCKSIRIYIADIESINECLCCKINSDRNSFKNDSTVYEAVDGKLTVLTDKKRVTRNNIKAFSISIKLSNIKFILNNHENMEEMYFDEIIIFDVFNDNICLKHKKGKKTMIPSCE